MAVSGRRWLIGRRGSFALEYAVVIVIVAAAVTAMAVYVKRALQGKWRQVGDTFGQGRQYEIP
jgi:Flp pilus assembly pilin Flp